jgi:hypothetical protein
VEGELDGWRECSTGGGSARRVEGVLDGTAVVENQNLAIGVTSSKLQRDHGVD